MVPRDFEVRPSLQVGVWNWNATDPIDILRAALVHAETFGVSERRSPYIRHQTVPGGRELLLELHLHTVVIGNSDIVLELHGVVPRKRAIGGNAAVYSIGRAVHVADRESEMVGIVANVGQFEDGFVGDHELEADVPL